MAYEVLARKWRPQQFDDVVGQEHVTRTLRNAIAANRIAHAYLFVGPRGIGKTSVARIFAKALNCQNGGPTETPCDTCDSCREIMAGTNLDVLEIDGASNNGVEQVRELRDTVKFAPTRGGYKVYIIDEVHMLSTQAFNALLKTLEEPPRHVKFFFATTEPEKILATIVSRCQRFDLRRISVPLIVERLELIAAADKVKIEKDALLAIARGSEGGMRDSQSALDQLMAFKGNEISEADVLSVFGLVARRTLEGLAAEVLAGDIPAVLSTVAQLDEAGKDLQRLVAELMNHFRNLLVCLNVDNPREVLDLTSEQVAVLEEQASRTDSERVLRITDVLSSLEDRLRFALSKRTLLETALIRCARAVTVVSIEDILAKLAAVRDGLPGEDEGGVRKVEARAPSAGFVGTRAAPRTTSGSHAGESSEAGELDRLREGWGRVVEHAARMSRPLRAPLLDARPVAIDGGTVTVGIDPEFAEEADNFKSSKARLALRQGVERVLNRSVSVEVVVAGRDAEAAGAEPASEADRSVREEDVAAPDAEPELFDGSERASSPPGQKTRAQWMQDPHVQQVLEAFNGSVVDVRQ